jgi:hypothetical protein
MVSEAHAERREVSSAQFSPDSDKGFQSAVDSRCRFDSAAEVARMTHERSRGASAGLQLVSYVIPDAARDRAMAFQALAAISPTEPA